MMYCKKYVDVLIIPIIFYRKLFLFFRTTNNMMNNSYEKNIGIQENITYKAKD